MVDIFISYSSKDEQIANEICAFFEKEGVNCWIAPRNIEVGKEYGGEIDNSGKYESENCTFKDNKPDDVYEEK